MHCELAALFQAGDICFSPFPLSLVLQMIAPLQSLDKLRMQMQGNSALIINFMIKVLLN